MNVRIVLLAGVLTGCGGQPMMDGGVDGGDDAGVLDAGRDAGTTRVDAGVDAGVMMTTDAGPPRRTVFGSMTVDGVMYELKYGQAYTNNSLHVIRLVTDDAPLRYQANLFIDKGAGAGFTGMCMQPTPSFNVQRIIDGGITFFTAQPTCQVTLSAVAAAIGDTYVGTFSGVVALDPAYDAGAPTITVTSGSFRAERTN